MGADNRTLLHVGPAPAPEPKAPRARSAPRGRQAPNTAPESAVRGASSEASAPRKRARPLGDPMVGLEHGNRFADGAVVPGTRYRVRRFLGDGGMGQVYEAEHMDLERPVAMKVLLPALSRAPDALAMFRREARAASRLGAEQIVQVYDFAELPDGRLMFAMELLDGPTLAALLSDGPLPAARVTGILRQVCKGLAAAHDAGVVHRDIKPENIVLVPGRDGRPDAVKILDFGISTILDDEQADSAVSAGTPYYLAPEFIAGQEFDGRMDQYALGCMAHELLSGRPPFMAGEGEGVAEILAKHLEQQPPRLTARQSNVDVPVGLQRVVLRCLAKDPGARYADANALEAALCEAQIDAKLTTSWDDLPLPQDIDPDLRDRLLRKMPDPHAPPARHGRTLLLAAVAVAAGAAAMYSWLGTDTRTPGQSPGTVAAAPESAPQVSPVDALVAEARAAAARSYFVVPASDDTAATTAYRKVRELEQITTGDKPAALAQALALRQEFSETLVRLGDQYWGREGGQDFAVDYYRQALVFVRAQPVASERAGLSPTQLAEFEAKAAAGDFTEQELLDAEPLVALAEPDDAKRRKKIKALRRRRKTRRGRADAAATERLVAVGDAPLAVSAPAVAPHEDTGPGASATSLAKTARAAMRAGKLAEAQLFLDRALTFDVNNRAALAGSFELQFRRNDYRAAVGFAQRLVVAHPSSAEGHLKLGDAYSKLDSLVVARRAYAKATALGSKRAKKKLAALVAKLGPEPAEAAPPRTDPPAAAATKEASDPVQPVAAGPSAEPTKALTGDGVKQAAVGGGTTPG